jgi:hypothetical protein
MALVIAGGLAVSAGVRAQAPAAAGIAGNNEVASGAEVGGPGLPEAPGPQQSSSGSESQQKMAATQSGLATAAMPVAPMYSRVIPAGEATPQIHGRDKYVLATRNLYSVTSVANFFVSAGWDQLTNGQPNYGTDRGAYGERLGAAAIRDSTQAFLTNGPFAVWLHQDPRYFELGRHHNIGRRTWYAATRALVTRSSSDGHAEFNTSLVLGQAAGTVLNNLYYPKSNRNVHDNVSSFGGSIGGSALSFVFDEFTADILRAAHLKARH